MLIFDAHLDLGYNGVEWNRNLDWEIEEIRRGETKLTQLGRQKGTVCFPELKKAEIRLAVLTVAARLEPNIDHEFGRSSVAACAALCLAHWGYYDALQRQGRLRRIETQSGMRAAARAALEPTETDPLHYVLLMECADGLVDPDHVLDWHARGLRMLGLTHYGVNRYGGGTRTEAPLAPEARPLLAHMQQLGMILDLTHLSDIAHEQALDWFGGPVVATHQNARKWANWQRQFSDRQILNVVRRGGMIGTACDTAMLQEGWVRGVSRPEVTLERVVDNIDHVCQLAGNAHQAGIGSDLDGGYGFEQTPTDLNTIADLQRLPEMLDRRGYSTEAIADILHGNWIRFFQQHLPVDSPRS
jgi:membrane dipeptidase